MKIIRVNNLKDATIRASGFLPKKNSSEKYIAFTGGRFGLSLLNHICERNFNIQKWKIFQTDERLMCEDKHLIQKEIIYKLSACKGFSKKNLNLFSYEENYLESLKDLEKKINNNYKRCLDLCFLSLGEDGHLAGQFQNSERIHSNKFCISFNAPKKPKVRISFDVSFLSRSKQIILVSLGQGKKAALRELLEGRGIHSEIIKSKELTIITDS